MRSGVIEWAVQTFTLPGQTECGDRHVLVTDERRTLAAVVDGLGHGVAAAAAAVEAVNIIRELGNGESLPSLVRQCHRRLQAGRGVVMSLAGFEAGTRTLTWVGVGNVSGVLRRKTGIFNRKSETLLLRAGVVGKQLPELQVATVPVVRGDVLILATDGIGGDFAEDVNLEWELPRIAADVVARYGRQTDDALVLVARFMG